MALFQGKQLNPPNSFSVQTVIIPFYQCRVAEGGAQLGSLWYQALQACMSKRQTSMDDQRDSWGKEKGSSQYWRDYYN